MGDLTYGGVGCGETSSLRVLVRDSGREKTIATKKLALPEGTEKAIHEV